MNYRDMAARVASKLVNRPHPHMYGDSIEIIERALREAAAEASEEFGRGLFPIQYREVRMDLERKAQRIREGKDE